MIPTYALHRANFLVIAIAAIAGVICLVLWFIWPKDLLVAWLVAVMLLWSRAIGSLTWLFILGLTGGRWGHAVRPWLNEGAGVLPLSAILFIPSLAGVAYIYPWFEADYFHRFENTQHREWFYQTPFFVLRTVVYFAVWCGLLTQAKSHSQLVAGIALVAILLTVTWASIDWIMSFDPFFVSTLLGVIVGAGAMLSALAYAIHGICRDPATIGGSSDSKTFPLGDLSSLLLASLLMWAYLVFSQFLIMWSGDLPAESHYYLIRNRGGWKYITPTLAIVGFVLPFICLLSHRFKRSTRYVGLLAFVLIGLRLAELAWLILPADDGSNLKRAFLLVPTTSCVIALGYYRPLTLFNRELI